MVCINALLSTFFCCFAGLDAGKILIFTLSFHQHNAPLLYSCTEWVCEIKPCTDYIYKSLFMSLGHHKFFICTSFMFRTFRTIVGFTLQAKLVSSKHLTQVHLKISSRTLENLTSHLMTKYTLEAQTVSHLSL